MMQLRQRGPGPQIRSSPSGERPAQRVRVRSPAAEDRPGTSHILFRRVTDVGPSTSHAPPRRAPDVGPSFIHGAFTYLPKPTTQYWGTSRRLSRTVLTSNPEDNPSFVAPSTTHVSINHS